MYIQYKKWFKPFYIIQSKDIKILLCLEWIVVVE